MRTSCIALLLILILVGCTRTVVEEPTTLEPIDPYGDPPDYAGDPFAGFDSVYSISVPGETVEVVEVTTPDRTELPYSVQITAAGVEATAQRLAETVTAEIDAPVFIDQEGSYWKVRVGAFATPEEADELLNQMQQMGFTDAWIVFRSQ